MVRITSEGQGTGWNQKIREQLNQRCGLCGQYILGHKGIKQHIQKMHSALWMQKSQEVQIKSVIYKTMLAKGFDCPYCGRKVDAPARHVAQCVVLLQVQLMALSLNLTDDAAHARPPQPAGLGPLASQRVVPDKYLQETINANSARPNSGGSLSLALRMHNPRQLCYANSSLHMLLHSHMNLIIGFPPLQAVWTSLMSWAREGRPGNIISDITIRRTSRGWQYRPVQEDASQYLQHLLQDSPEMESSRWEARSFVEAPEQHTRIENSGCFLLYIPMLDHSDDATMQDCIKQWHSQVFPHGLRDSAPVICLQLPRFTGLCKDHRRITLTTAVTLPVFQGDTLEVTWERYELWGGILHLGPDWDQGHYRIILQSEGSTYIADDGILPQLTELTTALIQSTCYLVMLHKA